MGPIQATGSVLAKYFTVDGRASRSEFWWWSLLQGVGMLAVICLDLLMFDPTQPLAGNIGFFTFFTPFYAVFTLIPNVTVAIRRLHDSGRSGFWFMLNLVPFGSLLLLVFFVLPSQSDENVYGPPPGGVRLPVGAFAPTDPYAPKSAKQAKSSAFASYAILAEGKAEPSAELREAQREQVRDYYRKRVLGNQGAA